MTLKFELDQYEASANNTTWIEGRAEDVSEHHEKTVELKEEKKHQFYIMNNDTNTSLLPESVPPCPSITNTAMMAFSNKLFPCLQDASSGETFQRKNHPEDKIFTTSEMIVSDLDNPEDAQHTNSRHTLMPTKHSSRKLLWTYLIFLACLIICLTILAVYLYLCQIFSSEQNQECFPGYMEVCGLLGWLMYSTSRAEILSKAVFGLW